MNALTEVRPGTNRYVSGHHILEELMDYLKPFYHPVIVTGKKAYAAFTAFYKKQLPFPLFYYDESSSRQDAKQIADQIKQADLIIGIGGGKVVDTAKMVAEELAIEVLTIPTLLSNCAPFTPICAIYYPDHRFCEMGVLSKAPLLTLVDWDFLVQTPKEYVIAGIGDTLAKWYECEGMTQQLTDDEKTATVRLGIRAAKESLTLLFSDSKQALSDLNDQNATPAFGRIVDTIILLAGEVGGFAARFGRASGAHAIHNGLSYLKETQHVLHGNKVAYGILVQLAYMKQTTEIKRLFPFYREIGLPICLKDIYVQTVTKTYLDPVLCHTVDQNETFCLLDQTVTKEKLFFAIETVERLAIS